MANFINPNSKSSALSGDKVTGINNNTSQNKPVARDLDLYDKFANTVGKGLYALAGSPAWNKKVNVYASSGSDEHSNNYNNCLSGEFTTALTRNMDGRSLAVAATMLGDTLEQPGLIEEGQKQHPVHSANLDSEGWISDPKRTSKAILIEGTTSCGNFDDDITNMKNTLESKYNLKDSDITVLQNPTESQLRDAMAEDGAEMDNLKNGYNSQVLVYYAGIGQEDMLFPSLMNHIDKADLINDVNDKLANKFTHVSVILDSCFSGSFV